MKINELEKIVNDGLVKYKVYKDADDALKQVKSLSQATEDLGKTVSGLEKDRDALLSEVSKLSEKVKAADKKAADIEEAAKVKALTIVEKAELDAKAKLAESDQKLSVMNDAIAKNKDAYNESLALQASLQEKKKELEADQARLNKVKADLAAIINVKA